MTQKVTVAMLLLLASTAHADKKKDKDKDKDKKPKLEDKLSFGGRVFARGFFEKRPGADTTGQAEVASARAGVDYKWESLRAQIEFEFATRNLKDAFVQLRTLDGDQKLDVTAGQFKMPFSAIQLTSGWKLPMADRGLVDNVLVDRLQVAGRHPGLAAEWKAKGGVKPTLTAGVFQGWNDFGDPLQVGGDVGFGQDVALRGTVTPADGIEVGAAWEFRSGLPRAEHPVVRHRWASEADVTIAQGGLRLWAEAFAGSSWVITDTSDRHTKAIFAGGRAIAAYRFGGAEKSACFVQPYALFAALDPDSLFSSDLVLEATGGISYGAWDVWRIQAELEVWRTGENAPYDIVDVNTPVTGTAIDATRFVLQAGAHF